ncbi:MAG: M23 family metallopeptidase [Oscillospiraceae bacterium]|nr:M23 family metallopeptidase [Oscillospiraceae bacterium]
MDEIRYRNRRRVSRNDAKYKKSEPFATVLLTQLIICGAIILVTMIIKSNFVEVYSSYRNFYKDMFENSITVSKIEDVYDKLTETIELIKNYNPIQSSKNNLGMGGMSPIKNLQNDIELNSNENIALTKEKFLLPLKNYTFTSGFGYRIHPITNKLDKHTGVDLAAGKGSAIYPTLSGRVVETGYSNILGNYIKIKHNDDIISVYGHCSEILVEDFDVVSQDSVIGLVGTTGISTGYHLHFEIIYKNKQINPEKWLKI